jgi:hypothetical protein
MRAPAIASLIALAAPLAPAVAQSVRVSGLSDVNLGLIANLEADSRQSEDICVFSEGTGGAYAVAVAGSGTGSAFALSSATGTLPFEVEWSSVPGQSVGTPLSPGVPLIGLPSTAENESCNAGPPASASLTIVFRATDLLQARAGDYSGSLTLLIAPE